VKIQAEFWVVLVCNVVVGYQCFRGPCHLPPSPWRWRWQFSM